ncbi:two-component system response regulator [Caulobacter sp. Root655]|jgi:CheY-like chemotaxis protein|uniref:response regulator n=1 Tax=Caulobacter sp. Root655 TaxID=1736578 RepID=UPI0007017C9F|nr:response regulator [Caulobacter sp. Root655]KRA66108.1 two-component system response regulator [Caulobacter sp. Root655]
MREMLQASTRINLDKVSVLIVDDSAPSLDLLAQVVSGFGVKTLQRADSAREAQLHLRDKAFDLIISATNMAGVDGYELVKWLRRAALEANRYVPVILVSGHTPPSQVFKARDAGANFTVAKPITPKVLLERILWAAKEERQFIECDSYLGPDRRFKNEGPPIGVEGRRRDDLRGDLSDLAGDNMSQEQINGLMRPSKVKL